MIFFWQKTKRINYKKLIEELQDGDYSVLRNRLAFYQDVKYPNGVEFMLAKMKRPDGDCQSLSLFRSETKGRFELAIFNVPWNSSDLPYTPLILERGTGVIYGIMLPFNEITHLLSKKQKKDIGELAISWTGFALESHLATKLSN